MTHLTSLFWLLASGLLPAAQSPAPAALVKSEFIYETAPFPSCHASTIVETPSGLVAAWFGGTAERNPDVGIWVSRFVAGTWTAPVEVANGVRPGSDGGQTGVRPPSDPGLTPPRYPTWNPVLFRPRTGQLQLYYKVGPSPSTWWGMMMTSADDGKTWSAARRLPDGILGPIKNKPVQLANGDIVAGSSTEHQGWRLHFERSTDNGATWTATPPLDSVSGGREVPAIQPSILVHKDGRLQAVGRTQARQVFETWSADQGRTWSPLALLSLPNNNAGTDAVALRDGRFAMVYNNTTTGRSPLNVAISTDGKTWSNVLTLEEEPGREFSYPAIIQTSDGMLHVTYTWRRQRIKHAVVDPTKF